MRRAASLCAPCRTRSHARQPLVKLQASKEQEGAALMRNREVQRRKNISRQGVVCDVLLGSALLRLSGDHLHRISIHDERSKCL